MPSNLQKAFAQFSRQIAQIQKMQAKLLVDIQRAVAKQAPAPAKKKVRPAKLKKK